MRLYLHHEDQAHVWHVENVDSRVEAAVRQFIGYIKCVGRIEVAMGAHNGWNRNRTTSVPMGAVEARLENGHLLPHNKRLSNYVRDRDSLFITIDGSRDMHRLHRQHPLNSVAARQHPPHNGQLHLQLQSGAHPTTPQL